jgi:hypothetical protein
MGDAMRRALGPKHQALIDVLSPLVAKCSGVAVRLRDEQWRAAILAALEDEEPFARLRGLAGAAGQGTAR